MLIIFAVSSEHTRPEERSLICEDKDKPLTSDKGATGEIDESTKEKLFKKNEILESILENQRKFLEDHDIKIQEIENVIIKIMADKEKKADDLQDETNKTSKRTKSTSLNFQSFSSYIIEIVSSNYL